MGRKRYKDQIFCGILEACAEGRARRIVYAFGLNFHTVIPHLELITRNGLVEKSDSKVSLHRISFRGEEALEHMQELWRMISERGIIAERTE